MLILPEKTSETVTELTTVSERSLTNVQIWHPDPEQDCGWREAKSLLVLCSPRKCWRVTLWVLSVDKKVETLAEALKKPLQSFWYACTHGLLSDRTCIGCSFSRMYGAKWLMPPAIAKASCSQGIHETWCCFSLTLKNPAISLLSTLLMNKVLEMPSLRGEASTVMTSLSVGRGMVRIRGFLSDSWRVANACFRSNVHVICCAPCKPLMEFSRGAASDAYWGMQREIAL